MLLPAYASKLPSSRLVGLAIGLAGVMLALFASGCGAADQPRWSQPAAVSDTEAGAFASPRMTYVVATSPETSAVEFQGRVRAREFVEVLAPLDGVLVELVVERGETVNVGDILIEAETVPSESDLLAVEILQLEANLAVLEERPAPEIDAAMKAVEDARAQLAPVVFSIEATAEGVVGLPASTGRALAAGEVVILIADPSSLVVQVELSPEQRNGIEEGATVTIAAANGANVVTETARIDRIIEPEGPTEPTTLSIPIVGDSFRLGASVDAVVSIVATPGAAWLPSEAVGRRDGASFVLVAADDGLMQVPVTLGRQAGPFVELLDGPPAGATVVGPS